MSWIIIKAKDAPLFIRRKLTWFYGIDAGELEDGDYALPEDIIADIEKFDIEFKKIKIDDKDSEIDKELEKFEKRDEVKFK